MGSGGWGVAAGEQTGMVSGGQRASASQLAVRNLPSLGLCGFCSNCRAHWLHLRPALPPSRSPDKRLQHGEVQVQRLRLVLLKVVGRNAVVAQLHCGRFERGAEGMVGRGTV